MTIINKIMNINILILDYIIYIGTYIVFYLKKMKVSAMRFLKNYESITKCINLFIPSYSSKFKILMALDENNSNITEYMKLYVYMNWKNIDNGAIDFLQINSEHFGKKTTIFYMLNSTYMMYTDKLFDIMEYHDNLQKYSNTSDISFPIRVLVIYPGNNGKCYDIKLKFSRPIKKVISNNMLFIPPVVETPQASSAPLDLLKSITSLENKLD
jgi:hypothetical protein